MREFHPSFLGLYGDEDTTAELAREFKAFYAARPPDEHGHYMVDHTKAIYVVDPQGRLRLLMTTGRTVDKMAAAQNPVRQKEMAIATFKRNVFVSPDEGRTWKQIAANGTGNEG